MYIENEKTDRWYKLMVLSLGVCSINFYNVSC